MILLGFAFSDMEEPERLDALLFSVAAGDVAAFSELYEHTKSSVYGFALSYLRSPHDAQDVSHDAYLKVWAAAARYKSAGKPMAWLLTIVKNLCLMRLREQKREAGTSIDELAEFLASRPNTTSEDRLMLQSAFKALSDEELRIISLHAVSGFKHREIAQLLGMPQATVITKYNRAIKKLQQQIGEVS